MSGGRCEDDNSGGNICQPLFRCNYCKITSPNRDAPSSPSDKESQSEALVPGSTAFLSSRAGAPGARRGGGFPFRCCFCRPCRCSH